MFDCCYEYFMILSAISCWITSSELSNSVSGVEWHSNLQLEQSVVTRGDLPRCVMDSYEECRGPPRLFLLDKCDFDFFFFLNFVFLVVLWEMGGDVRSFVWFWLGLIFRELGHAWNATPIHHLLGTKHLHMKRRGMIFRERRNHWKQRYVVLPKTGRL